MSISVTTTGSGAFADGTSTDNLVSVQVDVSASPLLLGDYSGGSTTISAVAKADKSASANNSQVMLENTITVTDTEMGSLSGKVNTVSIDQSDMVTVGGSTIVSYLDTDFDAKTCSGWFTGNIGLTDSGAYFGGLNQYTLKNALSYYFYGVNLYNGTTLDYSGLTANPVVNIPSWSGNLLAKIKEMCAIYRMRFWATDDTFYFADMTETVIDASYLPVGISAATKEPARSVAVKNYNTSFVGVGSNNAVLYYDPANVIEVDANTTATIVLDTPNVDIVSIDPGSIVDPAVAFDFVSNQQYTDAGAPYTRPTGSFFSIIDANGVPIPAAAWRAAGGGSGIYTGAESKNTQTVLSLITPSDPDFTSVFKGPYKLAVENLTGEIVSSLVIAGAGLLRSESSEQISVGKNSATDYNTEVDSPFVYDALTATSANYYAAAFEAKPELAANFSDLATKYSFSDIDRITFVHNYNKYKVDTASVTYPSISISAMPATSIADLDAVWTGSTIATLDAKISGYTINDWSSIPLVR
jgi:hypothetical protein